jgi:hypothetical protein
VDYQTVKIIQFQPCQAGVDRGPKMVSSAAYGLATTEPDEHLLELLLARGILAKKRLPLAERIDELSKFLRSVPKVYLQEFYHELDTAIGNSDEFRTEGIVLR